MSRTKAAVLAVTNITNDCWHAALDRKLRSNVWDIGRFRFAQFRGAYLGFSADSEPDVDLLRRFYYPHQWARHAQKQALGKEIDYSWVEPEGNRS
jgi:hypothetical protein